MGNAESLVFREKVLADDIPLIKELVRGTGVFYDYEVNVAEELLLDGYQNGEQSYYRFLIAEADSSIRGYACYSYIAGTKGSLEIYWIAVKKECQGMGIGRKLIKEVEKKAAVNGVKRIVCGTSSRADYFNTRCFYEKCGFQKAAELKDYYDFGDNLVIFMKYL